MFKEQRVEGKAMNFQLTWDVVDEKHLKVGVDGLIESVWSTIFSVNPQVLIVGSSKDLISVFRKFYSKEATSWLIDCLADGVACTIFIKNI